MLEHLGEHLLRDHAVLEHVRHARRHAQVVLEHVDRAVAVAHEIRAADVGPHAVRRFAADAGRQEIRGRRDDVVGHDAVVDDAPVVIQVVDEVVERLQALNQAALDARPLGCLDRARNHVERPGAVDVLAFGVDREGDAHLDDGALRVGLPLGELARAERRQDSPRAAQPTAEPCRERRTARRRSRRVGIGSSRCAWVFWVTIPATTGGIDSTKRCSGTRRAPKGCGASVAAAADPPLAGIRRVAFSLGAKIHLWRLRLYLTPDRIPSATRAFLLWQRNPNRSWPFHLTNGDFPQFAHLIDQSTQASDSIATTNDPNGLRNRRAAAFAAKSTLDMARNIRRRTTTVRMMVGSSKTSACQSLTSEPMQEGLELMVAEGAWHWHPDRSKLQLASTDRHKHTCSFQTRDRHRPRSHQSIPGIR